MRKKQISKDNVKAQTALLETRKKAYDLTLKELKDLDEMYVMNVWREFVSIVSLTSTNTVNIITNTNTHTHRYKARRDEDIAEDEIQNAMRNLETSKGDSKKHAQAMEMLKKAREHRQLAHAHFETSKKHHMMAQQSQQAAEREEKVAMQKVERAIAAESAIDEAIIDDLKNPVFEKHDDKNWLHKLEQDHLACIHHPRSQCW